jgi:hypothetical protein
MQPVEIKEGINPKDYFPNSKYVIVYAFSIAERHYFRFDDPLNTPYDRALKCLVYYKELDMNCDRGFIKAHTEAFDNAFLKNKIDINTLLELKQLNDQLKQRLALPKEPDLMYKLASVIFFDQNENPTVYEFKYGENKIKAWKKNTSLTDFFLSKPLRELIPYLEHAGINLEQFSRMIEKESAQHSKNISAMLSGEQKTAFLNRFKSLQAT